MLQRDLQQTLHTRSLELIDRIAALARPLDPERLVRRPPSGGWSVGHVLEHLCVTSELYEPPIRALLASARPDAAAPLRPWKPTLIGRFTVNLFERPTRLRAPKRMVPGPSPRGGVVEAFLAHQRTVDQLLGEASGFDWRRLRMSSPVVSLPLRFNLGDVFSILVVHAERHTRQVERVVAETS
ncbi:MAG: DinB family protein [Gemmatimonadetes bacterium]|nr:DinB family protein [Gemmatimonadota bacterium]